MVRFSRSGPCVFPDRNCLKIGSREQLDMLIENAFSYVQTGVSDTRRRGGKPADGS